MSYFFWNYVVSGRKRRSTLYRPMGSFHSLLCHLFKTAKNWKKMTELIPYLSGVVTIMFGIAFYLGLQEFKKLGEEWQAATWHKKMSDTTLLSYQNWIVIDLLSFHKYGRRAPKYTMVNVYRVWGERLAWWCGGVRAKYAHCCTHFSISPAK